MQREREPEKIFRIALFNIRELSMDKLNEVDSDGVGDNSQLLAAAQIIQQVKPDILVLNEIDHDYSVPGQDLGQSARIFTERYLKQGAEGLELEHVFAAPCNTGLLSGVDLNGDGKTARRADEGSREHGDDSFGFGTYPGQYSMALLSRYPVAEDGVRTFQKFLWKDLPGHHMPADFYSVEAREILRLSSKSHWDVPLQVDDRQVHFLLSHPTPRGFDGDEDRNGRRNFDEIKFWVEYLDDGTALYDDKGQSGGLRPGALFVIAGDLNSDPFIEDSPDNGKAAISQLLAHPGIRDTGVYCVSAGPLEGRKPGPPRYFERNTFSWRSGVRFDYILPSRKIDVVDGSVFWPDSEVDPEGHRLAEEASDHRLVWIDVSVPHSTAN
jgi:endonuclease/exonuclease/phosphatase family metal-dependent hydrolase